jgi:hypothetical protein
MKPTASPMRHVGRCADIYGNDVDVFVTIGMHSDECEHCSLGACEQVVCDWAQHGAQLVSHRKPVGIAQTPARMLADAWIASGLPMPQRATAMVELN